VGTSFASVVERRGAPPALLLVQESVWPAEILVDDSSQYAGSKTVSILCVSAPLRLCVNRAGGPL